MNIRRSLHGTALTTPQASEATLSGILAAAPDAILSVDGDGRIASANAQAERLFGYATNELLGQLVVVLIPEKLGVNHPALPSHHLGDPQPRPRDTSTELTGRRKDGSEFPAEVSVSTVDTTQGVLVAAAVRDVTERKRAEAKFRGLLESSPDALIGVGPDGRISLVNAQAELIFGYQRDELIGYPIELLVPERSRDVHASRIARYFADPRPRKIGAGLQLAGLRRDGSEFPAEISLSAFETEDGLLCMAAVRDVTERLEAQAERERMRAEAARQTYENQLHQSQRLESLGQLAGGVAHDFNNLLGVILIYTSLVAEEVTKASRLPDGDAWNAVRTDVDRITQAANRATDLTHQLLAFGRRELVRPRALSLNAAVSDIEALLRRTLGEQVELVTTLAGDLWPVVADPGQLEQVLVNLAVNARDSMPGGGTLTIDTANFLVDEAFAMSRPEIEPGRYVRLRVTDSGTGMPPEVIDRAFEPFFTTKPKGEGSGLGLATVYGIIKQAGGHAQIHSELNLGTTLSALLPASAAILTESESLPEDALRHTDGETVLVVEDEEALREATRRILARNGYQVLSAATGRQAIDLAAEHPGTIDLLLTDVIMPKMLGKEVAEHLSASHPGLRVLYMSGYAHPLLTSQGTLDAGVALVEKPFTEQQLLERVRSVLEVFA